MNQDAGAQPRDDIKKKCRRIGVCENAVRAVKEQDIRGVEAIAASRQLNQMLFQNGFVVPGTWVSGMAYSASRFRLRSRCWLRSWREIFRVAA